MEQLAPNLLKCIKPATLGVSVSEELHNNNWVCTIKAIPSVLAIVEFIELWSSIRQTGLNPGVADAVVWRPSTNEKYSAKSTYNLFFIERTPMPCARSCGWRVHRSSTNFICG
jgi:hypothetical protein